jgi:hypothetical protein
LLNILKEYLTDKEVIRIIVTEKCMKSLIKKYIIKKTISFSTFKEIKNDENFGIFPTSITHLEENDKLELNSIYYKYLEKLFLGNSRQLDSVDKDNNIDHLTIADTSNIIKKESIPKNLLYLEFSNYFNNILTGMLPDKLKTLIISNFFDKPIFHNDLPESLTALDLGMKFNSNISEDVFLPNLKYLNMSNYNRKIHKGFFSENISQIFLQSFCGNLKDILPSGLEKLILTNFNNLLNPKDIPNTVKHLELNSYNKTLKVGTIPDGVQYLIIGDVTLFKNCLPESIVDLTFINFNKNFKQHHIPKNTKFLSVKKVFGPRFKIEEFHIIPKSVKYLTLSDSPKYSMNRCFSKITHLTINYTNHFKWKNLARNIKYLRFGNFNDYKTDFDKKINFKGTPAKIIREQFINIHDYPDSSDSDDELDSDLDSSDSSNSDSSDTDSSDTDSSDYDSDI